MDFYYIEIINNYYIMSNVMSCYYIISCYIHHAETKYAVFGKFSFYKN